MKRFSAWVGVVAVLGCSTPSTVYVRDVGGEDRERSDTGEVVDAPRVDAGTDAAMDSGSADAPSDAGDDRAMGVDGATDADAGTDAGEMIDAIALEGGADGSDGAATDAGVADVQDGDVVVAADLGSGCLRTLCGSACVDVGTDRMNCGSCGTVCPPGPANSTPSCSASACGFTCDTGYGLVGGSCVSIAAPRPIAPLSSSVVTSRRPTLTWALPSGVTGAQVEVCQDRECSTIITSFPATGTSMRPAADLPARSVVFWRLAGRIGSSVGTVRGAVWEFTVGARNATVADTSWGTSLRDINGDGYDDFVQGSYSGATALFYGSSSGISPSAVPTPIPNPLGAGGVNFADHIAMGDLDRNGYADLVITSSGAASGAGRAFVYMGSGAGLVFPPITLLPPTGSFQGFGYGTVAADFNGDGFCDLAVGSSQSAMGSLHVYRGSRAGLITTPDVSLTTEGVLSLGAADVNGDGLAELVSSTLGTMSNVGIVRVYRGNATTVISSAAVTTLMGSGTDDRLGYRIVGAGDVDRDGYGDLAISASDFPRNGTGRVQVHVGSASGLVASPVVTWNGTGTTNSSFANLAASDFNGDGYGDVLVGEGSNGGAAAYGGFAYVFLGGATGLPTSRATASRTITAPDNGNFGFAVGAADLNGDGFADAIVNAFRAGPYGRDYIYPGGSAGLPADAAPTLSADVSGPFLGAIAPR